MAKESEKNKKEFLFETEDRDRRYFHMNEMAHKMTHMKKIWMVRKCETYHQEHRTCKSFKGRFHQLYVNGKYEDCSEKKNMVDNCNALSGSYDEDAGQRLIDYEEKRIAARLQAHFDNDVWEKRTEPPEDWNKPLPEALAKLAENSLLKEYQENDGVLSLQMKSKSLTDTVLASLPTLPSCTIM